MNFIIKSQRSSNDVVKLNPKAALFVCNRWDMVPQESKKAVRENALKQLRKAWPKFDSSNVVFFSTIKPMQKISINEGFISEENVELMYGFKNFVKLSLDHRIKASYRYFSLFILLFYLCLLFCPWTRFLSINPFDLQLKINPESRIP
jgi:hypothetical protein